MLGIENLQRPDAVFWDWDGTFIDSYGILERSHNYTLERLGMPLLKDGDFRQYFGKPRDAVYSAIYDDRAKEAEGIRNDYLREHADEVKAVDGSANVVKLFHRAGILNGIVSNKLSDTIRNEVKTLGLEEFFSVVIGAGDADEDKPSGAPLLLALERAGISRDKAARVWFVGDTEYDLKCAQEAGCPCFFIKGVPETDELIAQYKPLIAFDDYAEFEEILLAKVPMITEHACELEV